MAVAAGAEEVGEFLEVGDGIEVERGLLITGQVGTGKTVAAINTMLWQVSKNCPTGDGVCVDDKGLYWETLTLMRGNLGRASDLILLQVRPENAGADWKPAHRFNFLDNPPWP